MDNIGHGADICPAKLDYSICTSPNQNEVDSVTSGMFIPTAVSIRLGCCSRSHATASNAQTLCTNSSIRWSIYTLWLGTTTIVERNSLQILLSGADFLRILVTQTRLDEPWTGIGQRESSRDLKYKKILLNSPVIASQSAVPDRSRNRCICHLSNARLCHW